LLITHQALRFNLFSQLSIIA